MSNRSSKRPRMSRSARLSRATGAKKSFARRPRMSRFQRLTNVQARGPELKVVENFGENAFFVALTDNGANQNAWLLNAVDSGNGVNNRIGNRIELRALRLRLAPQFADGVFNSGGGSVLSANFSARCLVFYDRQPTGALPSLDTVLATWGQGGLTTYNSILNGINVSFRERFVVLADEMISCPFSSWNASAHTSGWSPEFSTPPGPGNSAVRYIDKYIKLKGLTTIFQGTPGAVGNCTMGSVWMYLLSDEIQHVSPVSCPLGVVWNTRLVYRDLQ